MDIFFMEKALELSLKGMGFVNPNPLVGAVIVKNGKIIGEGYHEYFGGPHAEINAFKNAREDVGGGEMYVTLEPCSHYGKTPPCADEIVRRGIKRVVVAMKDPNPLVAGRGIEILKKAGIEVVTDVLEEKAKRINEVFIKYITTKRPFCILKTAMTIDGKIATKTGDSKWISCEESREYVHRLRHRLSGVMVGIGTVLSDDPMLTTRLEGIKASDPTRIIVDSNGRIPLDSKVLNIESNAKTIIAVTEGTPLEKVEEIKKKGALVVTTPSKNGRVDLKSLMEILGEMGIDGVLLEGGSTLNFSALEDRIVDKVMTFVAPKIIGGEGKTPVGGLGLDYVRDAFEIEKLEVTKIGVDILLEGLIKGGE